jgi:hypothetical protein
MAYLFSIDNQTVYPYPETILIEPFKSIWERDRTRIKNKALEEFAYIEFMASMKKTNPFRQYPEERKHDVIKEAVINTPNWEPDSKVEEAVEKLKELQTNASTTYSYYMAAKKAAEKMQHFFEEVDLNERNFKTGNPVYKPSDVTRALNDTEKTLQTLKSLEKKIQEELLDSTRLRSDKQISRFADPDTMEQI